MDIVDTLTARLRVLMKEHGVKAAPLARRAQLNESAVRDILRGRSKNPGIVTLTKIAGVMNLRPSALFESGQAWPGVGSVGVDGEIVPIDAEPVRPDHVENPFFEFKKTPFVAVVNRGDGLAPLAFEGDHLIFAEEASGVSDGDLGRPCVCTLGDGRRLVRILRMGEEDGRHHLMPLNPFGTPEKNVRVASASRIALVLPEAFTPNLKPVTHETQNRTLHEEKAAYRGPGGRS